jgi:hypothetical protein
VPHVDFDLATQLHASFGNEIPRQQQLVEVLRHSFGPGTVKAVAMPTLAERRLEVIEQWHL